MEQDNWGYPKRGKKSGLKPCPFCGSDVKKMTGILGTEMFVCRMCGADVCFYGGEREPQASKRWNRRSGYERRSE